MSALHESTYIVSVHIFFCFSSPSAKPLKRASKIKLKAKAHPQKATVNTDGSAAKICPHSDLVSHQHSNNSRVMIGTTNSEIEHPGDHTCMKGLSEGHISQSSASVPHLERVPSKSHIHHKGTNEAAGSTYSIHRLVRTHIENRDSHQPVQYLSDGKSIT